MLYAGHIVTYSYACSNIVNTTMTRGHSSLKNIPLTLFERVTKGFYVWKVSWRQNKAATYWPPLSGYSSISFSFCWAAQPGARFSLLKLEHWLQTLISNLPRTSCRTGLYNCLKSTCFSERRICTQFNPSTVKVIPWYLRPDAPVFYTGSFLIWQLGRVGGQYVTILVQVKMKFSPADF